MNQTNAWKNLPLADKRQLLQYIKENRHIISESTAKLAKPVALSIPPVISRIATEDDDYDNDNHASTRPVSDMDDNHEKAVLNLDHNTPKSMTSEHDPYLHMIQKRGRPQEEWKIVQNTKCSCGETHKRANSSMAMEEIKVMMITLGDYDPPCDTSAFYVQNQGEN